MSDTPELADESTRWRLFSQAVDDARQAFADVPPDDLQKLIDEAVEEVRAKRYRTSLERPRD